MPDCGGQRFRPQLHHAVPANRQDFLDRKVPWRLGALVAASAMAGDCLSSFIKRRFGLEPSEMTLGLDQVPESLFPAVACSAYLPLLGRLTGVGARLRPMSDIRSPSCEISRCGTDGSVIPKVADDHETFQIFIRYGNAETVFGGDGQVDFGERVQAELVEAEVMIDSETG